MDQYSKYITIIDAEVREFNQTTSKKRWARHRAKARYPDQKNIETIWEYPLLLSSSSSLSLSLSLLIFQFFFFFDSGSHIIVY